MRTTPPVSALAGLETFLRGMETRLFSFPWVLLHSLETFLRGMETRSRRKAVALFASLETFLRGMETGIPICRP